jgi:hypothetical protein
MQMELEMQTTLKHSSMSGVGAEDGPDVGSGVGSGVGVWVGSRLGSGVGDGVRCGAQGKPHKDSQQNRGEELLVLDAVIPN